MPDEIEQATELVERQLSIALAGITGRGRELHPTGQCHFCAETLGELDAQGSPARDAHGELLDRRLFCDEFCSEDWEREKRRKAMR